MVIMFWLFTIAGILTTTCIEPFMLLSAYLKTFLTPEPVYSFEVYEPALFSQFYSYPAITIPWMLNMQHKQIINNRLIFIRQFRLISLGAS